LEEGNIYIKYAFNCFLSSPLFRKGCEGCRELVELIEIEWVLMGKIGEV